MSFYWPEKKLFVTFIFLLFFIRLKRSSLFMLIVTRYEQNMRQNEMNNLFVRTQTRITSCVTPRLLISTVENIEKVASFFSFFFFFLLGSRLHYQSKRKRIFSKWISSKTKSQQMNVRTVNSSSRLESPFVQDFHETHLLSIYTLEESKISLKKRNKVS